MNFRSKFTILMLHLLEYDIKLSRLYPTKL